MHKIMHTLKDTPTCKLVASGLPVAALLQELYLKPELWDRHDYRWRNDFCRYEGNDILLRFQLTGDNREMEDLECHAYPAWDMLPIFQDAVFGFMRALRGERLGRVMIVNLPAGAKVGCHIDVGPPAEYYSRFHFILTSGEGCEFTIGDDTVQLNSGELWWFNHNDHIHHVDNRSGVDRVSLIMDIRTPMFKPY